METLLLIGQIIVGLLLLTLLVVIHELGHAIAARRNGVVVEEFGVGFPPRAWAKKVSKKARFRLHELGTISINWLPLGGFVKLQGESDDASKKGDYGAAPLWAKTKILLAGVMMNWVTAALLFTVVALFGFPKIVPDQFHVPSDTVTTTQPLTVAYVEKGSPADKAGIKEGARITFINNTQIETPEELAELTQKNKGNTIEIQIAPSDPLADAYTVKAQLRENAAAGQGILGVSGVSETTYRSTWSAPIVGIGTTIQFSAITINELGKLFGNLIQGLAMQVSGDQAVRDQGNKNISDAGANVAGPIGILGVIFPAAQEAGIIKLFLLLGIVSLTLAVMNALPIPALDGGRLFVTLLFRALRKPLTKETEEKIHGLGFNALLLLIIIITISDVFKFF